MLHILVQQENIVLQQQRLVSHVLKHIIALVLLKHISNVQMEHTAQLDQALLLYALQELLVMEIQTTMTQLCHASNVEQAHILLYKFLVNVCLVLQDISV